MREIKLVVLGGGGVGKTALTVQFALNYFVDDYDPTIEDTYRKQIILDGEYYYLDILDTAGQEEYSAMRDYYVQRGDGFLVIYSVTSRASFDELADFRERIYRVKDKEPSSHFPIILIGNKSDAEAEERQVSTKEGKSLAKEWRCGFRETSAKNRSGVQEAWIDAVNLVRNYAPEEVAKKKKRLMKLRKQECSIL